MEWLQSYASLEEPVSPLSLVKAFGNMAGENMPVEALSCHPCITLLHQHWHWEDLLIIRKSRKPNKKNQGSFQRQEFFVDIYYLQSNSKFLNERPPLGWTLLFSLHICTSLCLDRYHFSCSAAMAGGVKTALKRDRLHGMCTMSGVPLALVCETRKSLKAQLWGNA